MIRNERFRALAYFMALVMALSVLSFSFAPIGVAAETDSNNGAAPQPSPSPQPTPPPEPTPPPQPTPPPPGSPNFVAVSNISLSTTFGQIGTPFRLNDYVTLSPTRVRDEIYPRISDIRWSIPTGGVSPTWGSTLTATVSAGGVLTTEGSGQGTVRVRATIPEGGHNRTDFVRDFTITLSSQAIHAEVIGLENLFVGVEVDAAVNFRLDGGGRFVDDIYPQDFFISNLPSGLRAEEAERVSNDIVTVRITGSPNFSTGNIWNLNVPNTISQRNVRQALVRIPVIRDWLEVGNITASSGISPMAVTFDLNRYGFQHRDFSVNLNVREFSLTRIRFGSAILREEYDFTRNAHNNFTIRRSFLERLPVGQWDLTFVMTAGANPTVSVTVIDTSGQNQFFVPPPPIVDVPGPPLAPPDMPLSPNENFIHLSGGTSVNVNDLRWDLNRARVTPAVQNGTATVTVRTHVLDHLGWNRQGETFEVFTPMARLHVPTNILDLIFDGRFAIIRRGLNYDEVDMRITITDVSGDTRLNNLFRTFHPDGEKLTSIIDIRFELVNVVTGEVILVVQELSRPMDITFVVMSNAAHLRPAGVLFQPSWLEFVPYRRFTPNEITMRTIFPGPKAVIHNRVHFEDIYSMHWGFVQSYTAAYSGLLFPVAELGPDMPITRGEFAQLLASALQLPRAGANNSGFTDILATSVFFDSVSRLFEARILGPYEPGAVFMPNQVITREEIAATVGMALILGDPVRELQNRPLPMAFADFASFTPHHMANVQATINYGVMVGYPDNTFRPQAPGTRIYALQAVMGLARTFGLIDEI